MKKLLVVALLAASIVSIADARCGKNRCAPKKSECEPCVKTQCIRPACIVGVDSTCDEGACLTNVVLFLRVETFLNTFIQA